MRARVAAASCPPFTRERCLRTAFISLIAAPDRSSARLTACLHSRETLHGTHNSADPPPESRTSTRSPVPSRSSRSSTAAAAAVLRSSGTGWAASSTMKWPAWPP